MRLWHSSAARRCRHAALLIIVGLTVLLAWSPAATADTPNPPWQQQCPQRIALVVDLSGSMRPHLDPVQESTRDLVDALRDAPNEVAVVTFGSDAEVTVPATNIGADDARRQVKDQIDDLRANRGSTNWEVGLSSAHTLRPDVVVLLTDGEPDTLDDAIHAADALKNDGIRVVGLGIGLRPESVANLVAVTGPNAGDDYYDTDVSGLSTQLYEIASKACGVPVAALPAPEPPEFPFVPVVVGGTLAVLAMVAGGMLLSRRRPDLNTGPITGPITGPTTGPTIGRDSHPGNQDIRATGVTPQDVDQSYPMRRERAD